MLPVPFLRSLFCRDAEDFCVAKCHSPYLITSTPQFFPKATIYTHFSRMSGAGTKTGCMINFFVNLKNPTNRIFGLKTKGMNWNGRRRRVPRIQQSDMDVSLNGGTPKLSILGFSMLHFGGFPPILGNHHIYSFSIFWGTCKVSNRRNTCVKPRIFQPLKNA